MDQRALRSAAALAFASAILISACSLGEDEGAANGVETEFSANGALVDGHSLVGRLVVEAWCHVGGRSGLVRTTRRRLTAGQS